MNFVIYATAVALAILSGLISPKSKAASALGLVLFALAASLTVGAGPMPDQKIESFVTLLELAALVVVWVLCCAWTSVRQNRRAEPPRDDTDYTY